MGVCGYKRLLPFRMIDGVGEILCFKTDAASAIIVNAVFSGIVLVVFGVELDAGTICIYLHSNAGFFAVEFSEGVSSDHKVMIIALLKNKRIIFLIDILPNGFCTAEIHGSTFDITNFSGGNAFFICYSKLGAGEL